MIDTVIPFSGRTNFLKRTLNSLNNQTYFPTKIVVVLDGVEKPKINFKSYINIKSLTTFVKNNGSLGSNYARNYGAKFCNSNFIHFLDDDDSISKNFYSTFLNYIKTHNNNNYIGFYYNASVVSSDNLNKEMFLVNKKSNVSLIELFVENFIGTTSSVILRRNIFEKVNGFDELFFARQDYSLWLKMSVYGHFRKIDSGKLIYTLHSGNSNSISNSNFKNHESAIILLSNLRSKISKEKKISYNINISKINDYSYLLKRSVGLKNKMYYFLKIFSLNPFTKKLILIIPHYILNKFRK